MAKLIVYYSRADENYFGGDYRYVEVGNTEKAAKIIAEKTGAELFKIEQVKPYAKDYNTCINQAKADQRGNARPELTRYPDSLEGYDEIYLGFPNYWGTMPMAVFTFLEHFDFNGKTIHPFCTHEGSGMGSSERDLKRICAGATVERGLSIRGCEAAKSGEKVAAWAKGLV